MTVTGKELMNDDRMTQLFPVAAREALSAAGCGQTLIDTMKTHVGAAFLNGVAYGAELANRKWNTGTMLTTPEKASTDAGTDRATTHTA